MAEHDPLDTEARSGSAPREIDQDAVSEQVDDDKLPADFPPDEPAASNDYGLTRAEQRIPEPIDERVRREKPDTATVGRTDQVGRLVEPDEGAAPDREKDLIADDVEGVAPHDRPVGDVGTGDVTTSETATELARDVSAEEDAVHERRAP